MKKWVAPVCTRLVVSCERKHDAAITTRGARRIKRLVVMVVVVVVPVLVRIAMASV